MENEDLNKCKAGIKKWQDAFNNQDAQGCADQYSENCVMHARPFGTFEGKAAILGFWQDLIAKGFKGVSYSDVEWQPHEEVGYLLSSKWTMNNAFGVVHKEHWVVEADGQARLISDDFEVLG